MFKGCGSSPVALPGVTNIWICDLVFVRLLVQEIKHVFNGEREGTATVSRAEYRLKQIINEFL